MVQEFKDEYRFLSNFWPQAVVYEGVTYPTVEHAYQAAKTVVRAERAWILAQDTPGQAKRLGQRLTIRKDWDDIKVSVMTDLVGQKFRDPELRERLLTIEGGIIEGNYWGDRFWGVDLKTGTGENHLGKILMRIRETLRRG